MTAFRAGVNGLKAAAAKGIPVVIMEPLRGGKLANKLPSAAEKEFQDYPVKRSPAEWAFRWLWNQPEVTVVLSGMNSIPMVEENVQTASDAAAGSLTANDKLLYKRVVDKINANMKVGCTGCRYCMPCPQNVDIPGIFAACNRRASDGKFWGLVDYVICTSIRNQSTAASNCIKCGKCEKHCPQSIKIREELAEAKRTFETPFYKIGTKIIRTFMKY